MSARNSLLLAALAGAAFMTQTATAQTVDAPGYIYSHLTVSDTTQACVAFGPGGAFVGSGPGFTGNGQAVMFVTESGAERTVVSGLNSISDCVYDASIDTLYVTDNGREAAGSVTGDTIFAIPSASTATNSIASALALKPAGSIPNAANVALDQSGNIFISDATGAGVGTVRKVRRSDGLLTTFITGFDFTGGLIWQNLGGAENLFVAETLSNLTKVISRYGPTGALIDVVSGPGNEHGSLDLALNIDNELVATGLVNGPVVAVDSVTGATGTLADGFALASALDIDEFTGRIGLVSATFVPTQEDFRLHLLTPISELAADGGKLDDVDRRECLTEFYGIKLQISSRGGLTKRAICVDGESCDADGAKDNKCTFPLGVCFNVTDPRVPLCASDHADLYRLTKAKPENSAITALVAAATAALSPDGLDGPACFFSNGVEVPVRVTSRGLEKRGTQIVKLLARSQSPLPLKDVDKVKLVCEPEPEP